MRYLSLFSGIEAASEAWKGLGWEAVAFSEIEKFPCAVLAHRWPEVPNLGDMTKVDWSKYRGLVDLVVGGSPCQAFSVAGLKQSLGDERGNLTLSYMRAIHAIRPRWFVWENVPGVLSTKDNAFGCFLAGLAGEDAPLSSGLKAGKWDGAGLVAGKEYSMAWRIVDAQFFGVPQRRRRVFLVGHLGDWSAAAKVLFEREGVRGNLASRRKKRQDVAGTLDARTDGGGFPGSDGACSGHVVPHGTPENRDIGYPCKAGYNKQDDSHETFVTHTLKGEGHDASEDGTGRGVPLVVEKPIAFTTEQTPKFNEDQALTLTKQSPTGGGQPQAVYQPIAFSSKDHGADAGGTSPTLRAGGHKDSHANAGVPPAVVVPIDMRQASRGEKMTNNRADGSSGGAPRTGIGRDGDPSPTITASHTPAVAYLAVLACVACGCSSAQIDEIASLSPLRCSECPEEAMAAQIPMSPMPFDTTQITHPANGSRCLPGDPAPSLAKTGHPPSIALGFYPTNRQPDNGNYEDRSPAIKVGSGSGGGNPPGVAYEKPVAFRAFGQEGFDASPVSPPVMASDGGGVAAPTVINRACVRRLTPRECERLQGFPDDYTLIPNWKHKPSREEQKEVVKYLLASGYQQDEAERLAGCPDGPRYKALGNSMAIPCMRFIGERIKAVEEGA